MQIQSHSTREAIAVNPVLSSGSSDVQVEAAHLGRTPLRVLRARPYLSPQLSPAVQLTLPIARGAIAWQ